MSEQCNAKVWDRFGGRPCHRDAKINEGGKWYCHIHSPEGKKKRNERLRAKWDAEAEGHRKQWAAEKVQQDRDKVLRAFCDGVDTETISTLTADGEVLSKWMKEKSK